MSKKKPSPGPITPTGEPWPRSKTGNLLWIKGADGKLIPPPHTNSESVSPEYAAWRAWNAKEFPGNDFIDESWHSLTPRQQRERAAQSIGGRDKPTPEWHALATCSWRKLKPRGYIDSAIEMEIRKRKGQIRLPVRDRVLRFLYGLQNSLI